MHCSCNKFKKFGGYLWKRHPKSLSDVFDFSFEIFDLENSDKTQTQKKTFIDELGQQCQLRCPSEALVIDYLSYWTSSEYVVLWIILSQQWLQMSLQNNCIFTWKAKIAPSFKVIRNNVFAIIRRDVWSFDNHTQIFYLSGIRYLTLSWWIWSLFSSWQKNPVLKEIAGIFLPAQIMIYTAKTDEFAAFVKIRSQLMNYPRILPSELPLCPRSKMSRQEITWK